MKNPRLKQIFLPTGRCQVMSGSEVVTIAIDSALQQAKFTPMLSDIALLIDAPRGYVLNLLEEFPSHLRNTVVVTWQTCPEYLADLWDCQLDALICLEQADLVQQLETAICSITEGQSYRTFEIVTALTPAERIVVQHVARGWADIDIADKLGLSAYTVRNRVSGILGKLDLKNRTQLALYYWSITPDLYKL